MSHRLNEARTRRFLWHRKKSSRFNGFTQRGEISSGTGWRISLFSEQSLWKHTHSLSHLHTHTHTHTRREDSQGMPLKWVFLNIMWVTYEKFPPPTQQQLVPPDWDDRENVCTRHTVTRCNAFTMKVIYSLVSYSTLILSVPCGVNCMIIFDEKFLSLRNQKEQDDFWKQFFKCFWNVFVFLRFWKYKHIFLLVLRWEDALNFKTLTPSLSRLLKKERRKEGKKERRKEEKKERKKETNKQITH